MNKVGQVLLLVGALVLVLLIGILIGRRGSAPEMAAPAAGSGVQISTEEPPPAAPTTPLVAPVQSPPPAVAPPIKIAPDVQVQEDAAAVGMTTRDEAPSDEAAPATPAAEPPVPPTVESEPPN